MNLFKSPLRSVSLCVNGICNLRCKMCDVGQHAQGTNFIDNMERGGSLGAEQIESICKGLPASVSVHINGTEPLLSKDLFSTIGRLKANENSVQLTTNGYLLPDLAGDVGASSLDLITVSIDGIKEVHDEIRGRDGSFERAVEGLLLLKNKYGKSVRVAIAVNETNAGRLLLGICFLRGGA